MLHRVDEAERQINADTLRAVFDCVFAPFQQVAQEGTIIDCADGKTRLCFPMMSARIADHAEHATLHRIGSRSCPRSQVPCKVLGENQQTMYEVHNYTYYREKVLEHELVEVAPIAEYFH